MAQDSSPTASKKIKTLSYECSVSEARGVYTKWIKFFNAGTTHDSVFRDCVDIIKATDDEAEDLEAGDVK